MNSQFKSPALGVSKANIDDIISQKVNPNSQSGKQYDNLQRSILNTGFAFPVLVGPNADYDPTTKDQERPNLIDLADGEQTNASGLQIGTQVSDDEIGRFFPLRLIDGSHRSSIVRLGKHYFLNGHDKSEDWFEGNNIPKNPGPDMLAYIAWRENFTIPIVYLEQTETEQMSTEILMNAAVGSQSLDGEKELVKRMLKNGKTKEWIEENLGIDSEVIERTSNQTGIKAEYSDLTKASKAWSAKEDNSYGRKLQSYLSRVAATYIHKFSQENPDWKNPGVGSSMDIAAEIGWNREEATKEFENRNK